MPKRKEWTYYKSQTTPKGLYLPKDKVCIAPNDRGFMLGDGVYEVIRTYNGKPFCLTEHIARLKRSLNEVRIDCPDVLKIEAIVFELLKLNKLRDSDATIYIQITRGVWRRSHTFPTEPVLPTTYMEVMPLTPIAEDTKRGVSAITVSDFRWGRCDIKAIGLLANCLARQRAKECGAAEAIFVRDGVVTEGTHTNLFGVLNGELVTHPKTNHILAGITRDTVIKLSHNLGVPLHETPLPETKLYELDELFLVGTTVEIMPVVSVNGKLIGKGTPGKITKLLQKAFNDYVRSGL
ncbi:MAG: aminotransferase class IV [candidate division WOR-3 bacterium]